MAESNLEHGRVEQRLHESRACGARIYQREQIIERKTMARIQGKQTRIGDRGGLDLEIELLAKLLAESEPKGAIKPDAERGMNHDLGAAETVEEAFDDQRLFVGNCAECGDAAPHVGDGLSGRRFI